MASGGPTHPSLRTYLLGFFALFAVVITVATLVQVDHASDEAERRLESAARFRAGLAAADVRSALEVTRSTVAEVAGNPGLTPVFDTPIPEGCSLTFAGVGPFTGGHIDVIDRSGRVRCSSEPLPAGPVHADAPWLDVTEPQLAGPVTDAATGIESIVVAAPVADLGLVATFLQLDSLSDDLATRYTGQLDVSFELVEDDALPETDSGQLAATEPVLDTGWTIVATVDRDAGMADADGDNRRLLLFVAGILLLMLVVAQLIYLAIARPIRELSGTVRGATAGEHRITPRASGPAEVVSLADDFATLTNGMLRELTRRRLAEEQARASEQGYRTLFDANPQYMWVHHRTSGQLLEVNAALAGRFATPRDELLALRFDELVGDSDREALAEELTGDGLVERSGPWRLVTPDGAVLECEITSDALEIRGVPARIVIAEDVTAQLRTQRLLEQHQRMESLGQLAGGIAHDFNNVLAVMLNYADFAAEELASALEQDPARWQPVLDDVQQVVVAGQRAAALTAQLLSFAKGEALQTGPVDINAVAGVVEQMLRRTLGEQIELSLVTEPDLWAVSANVGQVEQVLVNLAVNARDAMPGGGRLLIETSNVEVDEDAALSRPELPLGRYVRLRVSDTGIGMDPQTRDRAFEPFFTTKERGNGTGLGLATVYGVVTSAGGTVHIYSEPGLGTSISVLIPATDELAGEVQPLTATHAPGDATVLVVEDDEDLRGITERILVRAGYQVVSAGDGATAEALVTDTPGSVDLLLTDVVMPGMLGTELALRLRAVDPQLPVLFMSGYAPPMLVSNGTLPPGSHMVDKPFSADSLVDRVRDVLRGGPVQQP